MLTMLTLFLLVVSFQVHALTVLSMNVEWFWDEQTPHEGQIAIGPAGNPPSTKQVELEAYAIAQAINHRNADIVGLVEVEGSEVVERIRKYLLGNWHVVFDKGRDTMTGQDVALLTRLNVLPNTTTDFPDNIGEFDGQSARPSKVLGVGLQDANGKSYYAIVAHLISKRSSNDKKRAAQANAIRSAVIQHAPTYDEVVVMGDMNDELGTEPLNQLIAAGLNTISDPDDFSYVFDGQEQLIDHILVSPGLVNNADFSAFDIGPVSDHRGVMAVLP